MKMEYQLRRRLIQPLLIAEDWVQVWIQKRVESGKPLDPVACWRDLRRGNNDSLCRLAQVSVWIYLRELHVALTLKESWRMFFRQMCRESGYESADESSGATASAMPARKFNHKKAIAEVIAKTKALRGNPIIENKNTQLPCSGKYEMV